MRTAQFIIFVCIGARTVSGARRLRKVVEIPDLNSESKIVTDSIHDFHEHEIVVANRDIFRLLEAGGSISMSMSMPTSTVTNAPSSPAPMKIPIVDVPSTTPISDVPSSISLEPMMTFQPSETLVESPVRPVSDREKLIEEKCEMSVANRSAALYTIASQLSSELDLSDAASSQSQALVWLDEVDPGILCPDENRVLNRYTAALMYIKLDGPNWINCGADSQSCINTDPDVTREPVRWMTESHECNWYGLFCVDERTLSVDDQSVLRVIDIPDNNVGGTLPLEIFELSGLEILTMDGNGRIEGTLPSEIAKLINLTVIDMDTNKLMGSIPDSLFSLTNLVAIDLNDNQFTGTLSTNVGNLRKLGVLQLESNSMTGEIPEDSLLLLEKMGMFNELIVLFYV
jgi:Leucine-rich repeat (LRR) protein